MKEDGLASARRTSGHASEPAIQVICLGSGGGPSEDNVTGFLVRSMAAKWVKNSVLAVDAGSHLASITRILSKDFPLVSDHHGRSPSNGRNGHDRGNRNRTVHEIESPSPTTAPISHSEDDSGMSSSSSDADAEPSVTTLETGAFAGLPFPHASARANALHVVREHVSTYLITHPHLDHLSGFVINTAAFHNTSRPKRLAALPFTVAAIKTHIFNNIVWPNLTDEDGGVGLVTFQRLQEGGNIALGEGSGRGYIEVCDGLGVRGFKVSHGHCMKGTGHVHRGSAVGAVEGQMQMPAMGIHRASTYQSDGHAVQIADGREARSLSFSLPTQSAPGTPLYSGTNGPDPSRRGSIAGTHVAAHANGTQCVIDSSAYFIRTSPTSTSTTPSSPNKEREILIFGDVEPDSLSLSPRTYHIWAEAAPKIAAGVLTGIFIECSYTNAQGDAVLYGHLAPRHLLAELQNLADMVREARRELEREREEARKGRKRKRASNGLIAASESDVARKSSRSRTYNIPPDTNDEIMTDPPPASPTPNGARTRTHTPAVAAETGVPPLRGVKVVVMHVKDTLADGPLVGEQILNELVEGERERGLGCAFDVAIGGGSYWF